MRQFSKANREAFAAEARQRFSSLGFLPFPPDAEGYDRNECSLRIMTDYGWFHVHIPDADTTLSWYDINGRFADPANRFGEFWQHTENVQRANLLGVALPSGKWNVSSEMGSDSKSTREGLLDRFDHRMELVNARQPTDVEEAAWQQAYAEESAKLKIQRAEWKIELAAKKAAEAPCIPLPLS